MLTLDDVGRQLDIGAIIAAVAAILGIAYYALGLHEKNKKLLLRIFICILFGLLGVVSYLLHGAYKDRFFTWKQVEVVAWLFALVLICSFCFIILLSRRCTHCLRQVNTLRMDLDAERTMLAIVKANQAKIRPSIAVFVPISFVDPDSFWMEFAMFVSLELQEEGYQPVVKYLSKNYSAEDQIDCLRKFEWVGVSGALVSLADSTVLPALSGMMGDLWKPYVLHDFAPDAAQRYFSGISVAGSYAYIDNHAGGIIAADIMIDQLNARGKRAPYKLLVVPGSEKHPHSELRIQGFRSRFQSRGAQYQMVYTGDGEWTHAGAVKVMGRFLQDLAEDEVKTIDGIFACNDDMALGVEDVLVKKVKPSCDAPVIIGFDNSYLLRQLWHRGRDQLIVGTVDAMVEKQAKAAVSLLIDLLKRNVSKSEKVEPKPKLNPHFSAGSGGP